jgi:hypothetical protein
MVGIFCFRRAGAWVTVELYTRGFGPCSSSACISNHPFSHRLLLQTAESYLESLFPAKTTICSFPAFFSGQYGECALQRQNTEISKQIFPEKEYGGLSPNYHIHASMSDLYIPTFGLPILLEEICRPILGGTI